jgi:peptidoglycan-associated lipoprotein
MISRSPFAPRGALFLAVLLILTLLSGCSAIRNRNWPWKPWQPKGPNTAVVMEELPVFDQGTMPAPITIGGGPERMGPERAPGKPALSISEERPEAGAQASGLETIYFDYNSRDLNPEMKQRVDGVARWIMQSAPGRKVLVEGHCDDRGPVEYNMSLGHDRAASVREELYRAGIPPELVSTVSYGKERPLDPGHSESAWAKNRRVQFLLY